MSMSYFPPIGPMLRILSVLVMNSGKNYYTRFKADNPLGYSLLILAKSGFFDGLANNDSTT